MSIPTSPLGNRLLDGLPPSDLAAIAPDLEPVELPVRMTVSEAGTASPYIYFPTSGIVSVVFGDNTASGVEVGIVGREGMTGLEIVLGASQSPHTCFVQVEGRGWRLPAAALTAVIGTHPDLRGILLKFAHAFMTQISTTAFANADFTVEERLARWLLLCADRLDTVDIQLTHEFLALMLSVRRPGVTVATHLLEGRGLIRAKRNLLRILNRGKLEELAGASYGLAEAEYARLLGSL